jgi:hypothetical protein
VVTLGALLVVGGSAMPWLRTGQRRRSSFELFSIVDRLGFSPSGPVGMAIRLWPLVPLLAILAAVATWFAPRWSLLPAMVAALYAGGVGFAVANVDEPTTVGIEAGPSFTALGAAMVLLGAGLATFGTFRGDDHTRRSDRRPHRSGSAVRDR